MSEIKVRPPGESRELVEADLYDDLLSRYERALVYAGELREKLRAQEGAEERVHQLQQDVGRLQKSVAVDEAYIRLLEAAFEGLGILTPQGAALETSEPIIEPELVEK